MERVTVSELRNNLSAYLDKVRAGKEVIILHRNRPIARLERVPPAADPNDRLQRLVRDGLVDRASRSLPLAKLRASPPKSKKSVLEALLEERRDGR